MNKIILILLMFLVACGAAAPNPDISPIKEKDKLEKRIVKPKLIWKDTSTLSITGTKPTFIYFTWTECKPCKNMNLVFTDENVIKQLLLFNTVKIEESEPDFHKWSSKYGVIGVPSFVVLASTKDKDFIHGFSGYTDAQNLTYYLRNVYATNKLFLIREQANNILEIF